MDGIEDLGCDNDDEYLLAVIPLEGNDDKKEGKEPDALDQGNPSFVRHDLDDVPVLQDMLFPYSHLLLDIDRPDEFLAKIRMDSVGESERSRRFREKETIRQDVAELVLQLVHAAREDRHILQEVEDRGIQDLLDTC
jgi:hypothetical protein